MLIVNDGLVLILSDIVPLVDGLDVELNVILGVLLGVVLGVMLVLNV